jgi:cysteine desulfurase
MAVINARKQCAAALNANPEEIYFTSGGTESDNWAIISAAEAFPEKRHIVTSAIEHPAVLNTCKSLEKQGYDVTYVYPDKDGIVSVESVAEALRSDTALVSVMTANNEIGTLQPVGEIGELCRKKGVLFHTDAVQAAGYVPIDVQKQAVDMLSLSAHKLGGFKGSGLLYVRGGTPLVPLINGGGQERGMRSGTENTAAIVALRTALEDICRNIPERQKRLGKLRDELIELLSEIPRSRLNGSRTQRLCGNVNMSFEGIEGESLVLNLDLEGICASSGSACASGSEEHSHVLKAIGLEDSMLSGSLRLTLSDSTTHDDIIRTAAAVKLCVERLRKFTEL